MQLTSILPSSRVHTRLIDRIAYANDASYFRLVPQAMVQPASISEIQLLFQFSQQNHIPMTFRAAGTSLSGQAVTAGILRAGAILHPPDHDQLFPAEAA